MKVFIIYLMLIVASILLVSSNTLLSKIELNFSSSSFVNNFAKYQLLAFLVSLAVLSITIFFFPNSKSYLSIGKLSEIATKEKWLGINGTSTWYVNGFQLLIFISLGTFIFMFLGVKYTGNLHNFSLWFIPYILLFSFTNSISEELIFRFSVIGSLDGYISKLGIMLSSAILFGLPHYYGNPKGLVGVLMSGVLGYILCKASIETKGLAIAWVIHFVQDLIIVTALMMMSNGELQY